MPPDRVRARQRAGEEGADRWALMAVAPGGKALLLLIRARGHGELTLVFRGGLPTYAKQVSNVFTWGNGRGKGSDPLSGLTTRFSAHCA